MQTNRCLCLQAEPYSDCYDLEMRVGDQKLHPGYGLLEELSAPNSLPRWSIRCRACGRQWEGEPLPGGGIYGDTKWCVVKAGS
ncbi:MAG: hypothetical protein RBU37_25420 [Myxococcota bacterium]|jgi:hypothetical protein|nr:hypothetical protein [Myxococcota bacterium]